MLTPEQEILQLCTNVTWKYRANQDALYAKNQSFPLADDEMPELVDITPEDEVNGVCYYMMMYGVHSINPDPDLLEKFRLYMET